MDICIDFDGTCVTHEFPNIDKALSNAQFVDWTAVEKLFYLYDIIK